MEMHQPGEMETHAIILLLPATIYERGFQAACFFFPSRESHLQLHINTTNTLSESKSRSLRELMQQVVRDASGKKESAADLLNWSKELIVRDYLDKEGRFTAFNYWFCNCAARN